MNEILLKLTHSFHLISEILEQHEKELAKYRSALSSSQEMWQSLQETTKKQVQSLISVW